MIAGKLKEFIGTITADVSTDTLEQSLRGVSIDSREVSEGNLFACVKGEHHDGHDYIAEAVRAGARIILVDRNRDIDESRYPKVGFVRVNDTLRSLGDLAHNYLELIDPRRVAITATNGKTTTKELTVAALETRYRTCSTSGNFNNLYGVPLSIFRFDRDCEVGVFEFGMSTAGEIDRLVEIVRPNVRVILNIGPAHLETMKTLDAIADAKFEILRRSASGDCAVLNLDDPRIESRRGSHSIRTLTFGTSEKCDFSPDRIYSNGSGHYHLVCDGEDIRVPLLGRHHIHNTLAALAVASLFDIPLADIDEAFSTFRSTGYRMNVEQIAGVTVINDAYNANPTSVKAAIETLSAYHTDGKRVIVFGDMLELGDEAEKYHREVGSELAKAKIDRVLLIGEYACLVRDSALAAGLGHESVTVCDTVQKIVDELSEVLDVGDVLLLKASRRLELERVETALRVTLGRGN